MDKKRAIYTVVFGDYEELNELNIPKDSEIDFLCFTDNISFKSDTWDIKHVMPFFPGDSIRSQRLLKIVGNEYLTDYAETIYVDNSVILQRDAAELFDFLLSDSDIAMPLHSFRENISTEFEAVKSEGLDSPERIEEQLSHYATHYPNAMSLRPFWTAIIARKQTIFESNFSKVWAAQVLRYSRRDQLSVRIAQEITSASITEIEIDNFTSSWHVWPVAKNRSTLSRIFSRNQYDSEFARLESENFSLHHLIDEVNAEKEKYERQLESVLSSKSWRFTAPLRSIRKHF